MPAKVLFTAISNVLFRIHLTHIEYITCHLVLLYCINLFARLITGLFLSSDLFPFFTLCIWTALTYTANY